MININKINNFEDNFSYANCEKNAIILGNVIFPNLETYLKYVTIFDSKYIPHFIVDRAGGVHQLLPLDKFSYFPQNENNKFKIGVGLLNHGFLREIKGDFYDIFNNKVKYEVFSKKWKGFNHWEAYSDKLFVKTVELIRYLFNITNIEKDIIGTNVFRRNSNGFLGVSCKSNHDKRALDLSPAWDFKKTKKYLSEN